MASESWEKIKGLFEAALQRKPEERAAFLDESCAGDHAMRREVESLLSSYGRADGFMNKPIVEEMADAITIKKNIFPRGHRLGHYEIVEQIGAGGMGEVYLAQDKNLDRKVALKLLPAEVAADQKRMQRFVQEAKAASALNHPNIITIYEIDQTNSTCFLATEFIEGETLRERIGRTRLSVEEAIDIGIQVTSAVAAAHEAGIVHRDIKPDNVMVRRDGLAKVLDLGLAKLIAPETTDAEVATRALIKTEPGVVMGTAAYMSPEQARGMAVDARTDIFSVGVMLYEMVAGCVPFDGSTPSDVVASILSAKDAPPLARFAREIPAELERIVEKALRKKREERYQTATDMLLDLRSLKHKLEVRAEIERTAAPEDATPVSSKQPDTSPSTSSAEYIVNQVKLHKRHALIALAVSLLAVGSIAVWYFSFPRAAPLTDKDTILLADFVNTTGDAAFDGTLKQALAIQLEQSPFLHIFPEERVRETLRLMSRPPDERVSTDIAREICQRHGLKAYLAGSISNLGNHLVITLQAVNAQTGETLAGQQIEAESKEKVLAVVGQAVTKLREKLGESLASVQKYNAPIEQATTSSLEALKAYSLGREQTFGGNNPEAILFYKRAVELDPNFARAYSTLGVAYGNSGQRQLAREAAQKAFDLRDRVSEHEKLRIADTYYRIVTGEVEKAIEALELVTRTYPRDFTAHLNLANGYSAIGQYEKAVEAAREAVRLNPNLAFGYENLGLAYSSLNKLDEARQIYEQALARGLDTTFYHAELYRIAFVRGDAVAMQQQLDWTRGKPNEYVALLWQSDAAAFQGQLRRARDLDQHGVDAQLTRNLKETAAESISTKALSAAVIGNCQQAREGVERAFTLGRTTSSFPDMGLALALFGDIRRAQSLADEYAKQYPKNTLANVIWLPAIRAAIEIRRNNPAQVIQSLQPTDRYERTGAYWPEYLRGQAYLAQHLGVEAAGEFQKILDRRGLAPTSVLYPLAHLGLARAAALQGDTAKARKAYQDFFAIWKDADPQIPILIEAKREYGMLK